MNRLILIAIVSAMLGACKQAPTDASTPAVPRDGTATEAAPAPGASPSATEDPRQAVNASIDSVLGDHGRYERVISAYQQAVAEGDAVAVAALVEYPLQATLDGKRTVIADRADFVANYDRIITPAIAAVIKAQEYRDLMVNSQGVMFGSGETWINGVCKPGSADCSDFEVRVVAIQPTTE